VDTKYEKCGLSKAMGPHAEASDGDDRMLRASKPRHATVERLTSTRSGKETCTISGNMVAESVRRTRQPIKQSTDL